MNNKKIFEKIITEKRAKSSNERPKYGLRKLTVGVVSCLLGYMMFFTPNVVAAEKVDQAQAVEATVESTEVANTENVEEESEQPKEETVEATETEQPVSHVKAYSSNAKETNAQDRSVKATAEESYETATEKTAEKNTEFKLTDEQKKQLVDAGFDEEQIQKIEEDIKLELEKDPNYDVEKHIKDAIEKLDQPELALAPEKTPIAVRDAAAPEDTHTDADAKDAVHGYVGVLVGGDVNANLKEETGQRFKPIEGVKVYFQWYEAKGNRTSPTYYAVSGADGQFHIKMKPYIGQDGKLVKFDADTTSSAGSESYKMWVDESTIPEGYQLQYSTGEGVEFTDRRVAGGGYNLIPNTLVNYRVLLMEKQDEEKACRLCLAKIANATSGSLLGGPTSPATQDLLQMKLIDAEYQFDRKKLIFYYSTSRRIDFRDLVRELFRIYKTRIWMCAVIGLPYQITSSNAMGPTTTTTTTTTTLTSLSSPSSRRNSNSPPLAPSQQIQQQQGISRSGNFINPFMQQPVQS
ncbi:MAG: PSP1 C-terminal domain-containing protein, partial [Finegoldia magna]|nr:PSP1 C-terminal domain-containing protein [Finegoldia magna]